MSFKRVLRYIYAVGVDWNQLKRNPECLPGSYALAWLWHLGLEEHALQESPQCMGANTMRNLLSTAISHYLCILFDASCVPASCPRLKVAMSIKLLYLMDVLTCAARLRDFQEMMSCGAITFFSLRSDSSTAFI